MPNYNVSDCVTNFIFIVSAGTLTNGSVIGFFNGEEPKCGVVGEITSETHDSLYDSNFETCCDCLSAATDGLNFLFTSCQDDTKYDIEATNFCRDLGVPEIDKTYVIKFGTEDPFCAKFRGLSVTGETNYFYVSGPFLEDCSDCKTPSTKTTYSAGTFVSYICQECTSGSTTYSTIATNTPHPSYTNAMGDEVIQTQMVTLGGPNGLNS